MIRKLKLLTLITFLVTSCSNNSSDYLVNETSDKISEHLKNNEKDKFLALIENKSTKMPKDNHFDILQRLFKDSEFNRVDPKLKLVEKRNNMGQEVYRIPYFQKTDSLTGITKISLLLYFGPKDLFPKNKLSGFETEFEYDKELRKKILEERFQVDFN